MLAKCKRNIGDDVAILHHWQETTNFQILMQIPTGSLALRNWRNFVRWTKFWSIYCSPYFRAHQILFLALMKVNQNLTDMPLSIRLQTEISAPAVVPAKRRSSTDFWSFELRAITLKRSDPAPTVVWESSLEQYTILGFHRCLLGTNGKAMLSVEWFLQFQSGKIENVEITGGKMEISHNFSRKSKNSGF